MTKQKQRLRAPDSSTRLPVAKQFPPHPRHFPTTSLSLHHYLFVISVLPPLSALPCQYVPTMPKSHRGGDATTPTPPHTDHTICHMPLFILTKFLQEMKEMFSQSGTCQASRRR